LEPLDNPLIIAHPPPNRAPPLVSPNVVKLTIVSERIGNIHKRQMKTVEDDPHSTFLWAKEGTHSCLMTQV
jgi:regulator of PEP synthase PpsR (kinase-PPPase family)